MDPGQDPQTFYVRIRILKRLIVTLALLAAGGWGGSPGVPSQPGGGRDRTAAALRPAAAHRHWSAAALPADQ
jgi:hypothetical protein